MPTNNFEKRVQEEMEGFKLLPSDEVWLIVEEKIRERKRRRFLFWLLPILLGGSMATYFLLKKPDGNGSNALTNIKVASVKDEIKKPLERTTKTADPGTHPTTVTAQKAGEIPVENSSGSLLITHSADETIKERKSNPVKPLMAKKVTNKQPANSSVGVRVITEELSTGIQPIIENTTGSETTDHMLRSIMPASLFRVQPVSLKNGLTSSGFHWVETLQARSPSLQNNSSLRSPKWIIGFKAGSYNIADPLLGGGGQKDFAGNLNSPGQGTGNSSTTIISEALPKPALSYGLMLGRQFPVGRKHYFKTGLGLAQYSQVRQVGDFRDSIASPNFSLSDQSAGFYRGGTNNSFRSHYQVIELPLTMMWQIGKNKNLPLQLETGLLYGRVIRARGLVYGGYGYFDDRDQVRKNQWQLKLGFSSSLFNRSKHPLGIGLTYQTGFHSFYKKEVGDPKTSHFKGLQLTFPF